MLTVCNDAARVEELLGNGLLSCPVCGGMLAGWGFAARRRVRGLGRFVRRLRPRRARCRGCGATHVLLPAWLLARRGYDVALTGRVLLLAAGGRGFRTIAAELGVPAETVRGWLRRFRAGSPRVRELFTGLAAALSADPVPLEPAGTPLADAVVAVAAAADAAWLRWPAMRTVTAWELASAVTAGSLMSPCVSVAAAGDGLGLIAVA